MRKIIWTCWLQGWDQAPKLVRACMASWKDRNPGWELRCLDAGTIGRYVDLGEHVDLARQSITAASLSDILRLLLLHEYGGVWVDATTYCNAPLDDWLVPAMQTGFFAFARPEVDRELASWFLAVKPGNALLAAWAARALDYWQGRTATKDYFWLHHQFGELIAVDAEALAAWQAVPRISADGPHSVQSAGFSSDFEAVREQVDWSAPVFKLTYRYDAASLPENSLLARLLGQSVPRNEAVSALQPPRQEGGLPIAHLRVGTENLGDHIQIIAGERIIARAGLRASQSVDRDDEIASAPGTGRTGILLNGWFKTNPAEWPPHPDYVPIYLAFHVRLFQSPSLVGSHAIAHYKQHEPVGCRDRYTLALLRGKGVDAFLSHCLTLTYPRRLPEPEAQKDVFVVSRDRRICDYLPEALGPYTFVNHYSGDHDFEANLKRAHDLLETYRDRARLIVTTLLHCALPAIAMGIPVVVFYPPNGELARKSDRERFSSLADIVRVFELTEAKSADWRGACPDVGGIKLALVDRFFEMAARWGGINTPRIEGLAPSSALPVPDHTTTYSYLNDPERLERLARAAAPDRQKWGVASSYNPQWASRAELAASFVQDGERILEVGTGTGAFRDLVSGRCEWHGTDLQPVLEGVQALDLEQDELPRGPWSTVVMLGVLEYIHDTERVLSKLFAAAPKVVMTYCVPRDGNFTSVRRQRGWVSDLTRELLWKHAARAGFMLKRSALFNSTDDFEQWVMVFNNAVEGGQAAVDPGSFSR